MHQTMMWRVALLAAVTAGALSGAARAAPAPTDDRKFCADILKPEDARLAACSRAIASGRHKGADLAALYNARSTIYNYRSNWPGVIADLTEVIRLTPNAPAIERKNYYYFRGVGYSKIPDYERAIADFTETIRLDPSYSSAYFLRSLVYKSMGDYDRAIADINQKFRLEPQGDSSNYYLRGIVYEAKGDYERAIADYSEAIRLAPNSMDFSSNRGIAYLQNGADAKALADLNWAYEVALSSDGSFRRTYKALWLEIATLRNKLPSRLAQEVSRLDMTAWPAPIVRLFLGQLTPDAALAAADIGEAKYRPGQLCDAELFIGERLLQQGAKDEAARHFRAATGRCAAGSEDWVHARAELKALGANP